jgi:23S rRNA U2552 (ribose-2'-O)-methylase RlmE/FtsJ
MVIIYKQELDEKVNTFITNNNIVELKTDPTQKMQRTTQNVVKLCKYIINPAKRKYLIQMNPQAPKLKAKIKIHKPSAPIRPVINDIYAPTHKVTKHIYRKVKDAINLKYEYNIKNTGQFAENLCKLELSPEYKLLTMDIKDLYVKIPKNHALNITNKLLKNNQADKHTTKDIMSILKMITNQNYFQYKGKYYKPTTGVAMGSALSGILA